MTSIIVCSETCAVERLNDVEGMIECVRFQVCHYATISETRQHDTCPVLSSSESKANIEKLGQIHQRAKGVRSTFPVSLERKDSGGPNSSLPVEVMEHMEPGSAQWESETQWA